MSEIDPRVRALYYLYLVGLDEMLLHSIFGELGDQEVHKIIWNAHEKSDYYNKKSIAKKIVEDLVNEPN